MAPQFTKTDPSVAKDNSGGLDLVAVIQAWAASSLEDHINVHTGLAQENRVPWW